MPPSTPDLDAQEQYYTNRWNAFTFAHELELARMSAVLDMFTRVGFASTPSICDLGCGAGWSTGVLGVFGRATGIDLSDTTAAAGRFPHCRFISANVLEWDAPRDAFDFVFSIEVIEHIERPHQRRYLDVAHKILKPGGHLILTTPNAVTMRAMPDGGKSWSHQPIEDWLTPDELRLALSDRFRVEEIDSIILGTATTGSYRLVNSEKLGRLFNAAGLGTMWRQWARRRMYGLHLVALARKG